MRFKKSMRLLSALILTIVLSCSVLGTAALAASRKDVTQDIWKTSGKTVTVTDPSGSARKYHCYSQNIRGDYYYSTYGCITTAVSIAASGFGVNASPKKIHAGSASSVLSEKYALKILKAKYRKAAMSLRLASQILTDMGIPNKRVSSFSANTAIEEIRSHLKAGKPVIVKAGKKTYKGVHFTSQKINHSVLGKVNKKINLTVPELVKFMYSSKKNTNSAYVTKTKDGGGYILVG